MNKKILQALKNPYYACELVLNQFARYVSDEKYIKWKYYLNFHQKLNLDNPQTFNEKLQWLKLYDRKPEYTKMVDKCEAKNYVASIIGKEYIIPTLGVWEKFDDIDFAKLPNRFVLKCTHDSASVVLCKDKTTFDHSAAREKLTEALKTDYYHYDGRQWAYKGIRRRIIAEEYLDEGNNASLTDYKFMVFGGKCKCVFVCAGRQSRLRLDAYDMDWQLMPFTRNRHRNMKERALRPQCYDTMLMLAEKIAGFVDNPFVRVDFYQVDGKVYFGEVTFYPEGGLGSFKPKEWDYRLGEWIQTDDAK